MTVEMLKPPMAPLNLQIHHFDRGQIPARIEIDGKRYSIDGMSADGSLDVAFDGDAEPGQILQTSLIFPFSDFDMAMPANCEVTFCDRTQSRLGLQVAQNAMAIDRSLLNFMLDAVAAGDVVSAGEILEVARLEGRTATTGDLEDETRFARARGGARRRLGAIFFVLLAAGLLAYIGTNVATRTFTIQADGAIVNPRAMLARTPVGGELVSYAGAPGARVALNAPVATLRTNTGEMVTIPSGCDCVIGGQLAESRSFLRQNQPVAQLVPVDGTNKAVLSVRLDDLRRVRVGDQVVASFYGSGAQARGTVERVSPPKMLDGYTTAGSNRSGRIEVRFNGNVPAWHVGEPVSARILLSRFNPFAQFDF